MSTKAFTLIELLVVIAIIAILAAILFPVFASAKLAAKKTNDLSHMKQLALANLMYTADTDGAFLPYAYSPNVEDDGPEWPDLLQPYTKNQGIFSDPSNQQQVYFSTNYWKPGGTSLNDTNASHFYRVTYTYNDFIAHSDDFFYTGSVGNESKVQAPAETVLFGPSPNWFSTATCRINGNTVDLVWDVDNPTDGWAWGYELWGTFPAAGYNSGANFSFTDGHSKYEKMTQGPDPSQGASTNGLYAAGFVGAKMYPAATSDGQCPADYSSWTYGFLRNLHCLAVVLAALQLAGCNTESSGKQPINPGDYSSRPGPGGKPAPPLAGRPHKPTSTATGGR